MSFVLTEVAHLSINLEQVGDLFLHNGSPLKTQSK